MRIHPGAWLLGFLLLPGAGLAQTVPGDVTFEVPLNLTRLAADIRQVDVTCYITSSAIVATRFVRGQAVDDRLAGQVVLDVTNGRLVTTARVVVAVPAGRLQDPVGKAANYDCMITAYTSGTIRPRTSGGYPAGWGFFEEKPANPSFSLTPTPQHITGSFTW